ncbi:pyridoxamine phosphate oxidase-like protein [Microthyrium microscopicum]|uniref:Pyridoxamine phosphate oxidase-like protein n=1 Tax=Microthyrium microscopicum TaxID=703497 RepID=A0A6A6UQU1_9PEZI|nr:pyridoxamine phosphate oxidase-like protein [Microthyrium microscopicum]
MATSPATTAQLPPEVVQCLENARFLHLATCHEQDPHISLMSYTYLPSTPYSSRPTIIMTTPPSSRKTTYLSANPKVSILVHDWVTHRPPTLGSEAQLSTSPDGGARSGLASLLYNINSASMSRISVSINGTAQLLPTASDEEAWYKARHKEHNTFGDMVDNSDVLAGSATEAGGAGCYIEDQEVRVVVVQLQDGRISDWKGMVKDWSIDGDQANGRLVNGA